MAKNCINPHCDKEIPSSASFCSFCGTLQDVNENLSEEEKLRKELTESEETIRILKKSLSDAHEKIINGTSDEEIRKLENELETEQIQQKNLQDQIAFKNREIEQLKLVVNKKKKKNGAWIFFFLVSIVLGISTIYFYNEFNSQELSINRLESLNKKLNTELKDLKAGQNDIKNENIELQKKIDDISKYYPMIIKTMKIGNTNSDGSIETDYGKTLYSYNSMYLKPQIEYIGLKPNQTITLYQKLYKNGILSTGTSSPSGYSTESEMNLSDEGTSSLTGWGNEVKGIWSSGNYRYEIWYKDVCLKAINFYLH